MTATLEMAPITECTVAGCSYNDHSSCHAFAITVGGSGTKASCTTFIALDARAGLPSASGHVGACKRLECVHNVDLLCTAAGIDVAGDEADCLTYEAR